MPSARKAAARTLHRRLTTAALGIPLLSAGFLTAPASAAAPGVAPGQCPAPVPVSSVRAGMTGQGLTVVRGKTPQPFVVEVLGMMPNGIAPGKDMIMVEVSDLAGRHVVDQGGGIWAGMSGSPVYVGGKLLGAVSYGFTASPSPIGGVTPAADMMGLLSKTGSASAESPPRRTVRLSSSDRSRWAARAAVAAPRGNLTRLPSPLSVSGLSPKRLRQLQARADAAGLSVVAYPGGSRPAPTAAAASTPVAGGNFGAVMSYGDLTAAAIGTTTAVCGSRALAFGHPFNFAGAVTYGASDATSSAIVKDNTFGSFKMANLGGSFGTVTQDRMSGISARLGAAPASTPITTVIRNYDTGRGRIGVTRVIDQHALAALAPSAVLADYDAAFDEVGEGRASTTWTIAGTRRGGAPFSVTRGNRWASRSDLSSDQADDLAVAVDALANNEFEPVTVKRVAFDSTFSAAYQQLRIVGAAVSVDGGPFSKASTLRVKAGAALKIRVTLVPFRSSSTQTATISLQVPKRAAGSIGALTLSGGGTDESLEDGDLLCLLSPAGCNSGPEASSLNGLISSITSAPRNDDLMANLTLESPDGDALSTTTTKARQRAVVAGSWEITLDVGR